MRAGGDFLDLLSVGLSDCVCGFQVLLLPVFSYFFSFCVMPPPRHEQKRTCPRADTVIQSPAPLSDLVPLSFCLRIVIDEVNKNGIGESKLDYMS